MSELAERNCQPCRADSPPVDASARPALLAQLTGWSIEQADGMDQLGAQFTFANFANALAFANRVGELAEAADHHPRIVLEWGKVEVRWWTHAIGGLHENDFIMAARTSAAFNAGPNN